MCVYLSVLYLALYHLPGPGSTAACERVLGENKKRARNPRRGVALPHARYVGVRDERASDTNNDGPAVFGGARIGRGRR